MLKPSETFVIGNKQKTITQKKYNQWKLYPEKNGLEVLQNFIYICFVIKFETCWS